MSFLVLLLVLWVEKFSALRQRLPGLRLAEAPTYADVYHFHGLKRLRVARD